LGFRTEKTPKSCSAQLFESFHGRPGGVGWGLGGNLDSSQAGRCRLGFRLSGLGWSLGTMPLPQAQAFEGFSSGVRLGLGFRHRSTTLLVQGLGWV
jgi:hypothetical protein